MSFHDTVCGRCESKGHYAWECAVRIESDMEKLKKELASYKALYFKVTGELMKLYPADMNGDTGVVAGITAEIERLKATPFKRCLVFMGDTERCFLESGHGGGCCFASAQGVQKPLDMERWRK